MKMRLNNTAIKAFKTPIGREFLAYFRKPTAQEAFSVIDLILFFHVTFSSIWTLRYLVLHTTFTFSSRVNCWKFWSDIWRYFFLRLVVINIKWVLVTLRESYFTSTTYQDSVDLHLKPCSYTFLKYLKVCV